MWKMLLNLHVNQPNGDDDDDVLNIFPGNLHHSSFKHIFSIRVENSVDPDQMA